MALQNLRREIRGIVSHLLEDRKPVHVGAEHPTSEGRAAAAHQQFQKDESGGEDVRGGGVVVGEALLGAGVGGGPDARGEVQRRPAHHQLVL